MWNLTFNLDWVPMGGDAVLNKKLFINVPGTGSEKQKLPVCVGFGRQGLRE